MGDPSTCTSGGIYYNSAAESFQGCAGGTWNKLNAGAQLDYAQITSNVTVTGSTTTMVITGNPVTYDGNTTVKAEAYIPAMASGTTGAIYIELYEDGTQVGTLAACASNSSASFGCYGTVGEYFITPTAGSHTFAIYAYDSSSAAGSIKASTGGTTPNASYLPAYMRITVQ